MELKVRPATDSDRAFIFSTFLRGLYFGSEFFSQIDSKVFFQNYQSVVEKVLERAEVRIACLEEDPDVVLGYMVLLGEAIVFAYTKAEFRQLGIQKKLLGHNPVATVTHLTKVGNAIRHKKKWSFNPFYVI